MRARCVATPFNLTEQFATVDRESLPPLTIAVRVRGESYDLCRWCLFVIFAVQYQ
jgi:hypothetical protein